MKALTRYAAIALAAGLWSCAGTRTTQQGEYDDLYFTSKDREQQVVASASSSTLKYDQMRGQENNAYNGQNANPDYVESTPRSSNRNVEATGDGDTYYDENYMADRRKFGSVRPSVTAGAGGGYLYSSPAYYDPFFSPVGFDPFYARNAWSSFYYDPFFSYRPYWGFRPGVSINIAYNNWGGWGRPWGWHDPFYGPGMAWGGGGWGYSAWNSWGWNDPFWGPGMGAGYGPGMGWGGGYYGGGWGGNTVIVGNGGNNGRDNTNYRNYGQRSSRGSELVTDQNEGSLPRGGANGGGGRSGRVDQPNAGVNTNPDAVASPVRPTRPERVSTPDSYGGRGQSDYNRGNGRSSANPDVITTRPAAPAEGNTSGQEYARPSRAVRPQGNESNTNSSNTYNQRSSTYYNNSGTDSNSGSTGSGTYSRPTYSAPRSDGNSGGSYSRPSRTDTYSSGSGSQSSGSSGSSGSYSGGRSGGSSSGSSGSSGGGGRSPRGQ